MNASHSFFNFGKAHSARPALWFPGEAPLSFGEMRSLATLTQSALRNGGVEPGQNVFILDEWGPRFWGIMMGVISYGARAVLIDPHLSRSSLAECGVLKSLSAVVAPRGSWRLKLYWRDLLRGIAHLDLEHIARSAMGSLAVDDVNELTVAVEQWRQNPRGHVVRQPLTHRELIARAQLAGRVFDLEQFARPALVWNFQDIWNNFYFGRGAVVLNQWSSHRHLDQVSRAAASCKPEVVIATGAQLNQLLQAPALRGVRAFRIGRSAIDISVLHQAFRRYPEADFQFFYGTTEHPLVFCSSAKESLWKSEARGFYQLVSLGEPVEAITHRDSLVEVDGDVLPDRIHRDADGYWYQGHLTQSHQDFLLEQKLYSTLGTSQGFLRRNDKGELTLFCSLAKERGPFIRRHFPDVVHVREARSRSLKRLWMRKWAKPADVQF